MNRAPLTFFVRGIPAGQPRVRATVMHGHARVFTPTKIKTATGQYEEHPATKWKNTIRFEAHNAWLGNGYPNQWTGPLCVNLTFYFPRPKDHFRKGGDLKPNAPQWMTSKPDRDNSDKAVLDCLTNLCLWGDDCLVCDGRIKKLYATPPQPTGCLIEIMECEVVRQTEERELVLK